MVKHTFVLFCLIATTSAKFPTPRDLADEAEAQAGELNSIVEGKILAAHNYLSNIISEFGINAMYVRENAAISIRQDYEIITKDITTLKDLSVAAIVDISQCVNVREQVLNRMPNQYTNIITYCITDIDQEATSISSDSIYIVDTIINKVHSLQFQLRQCQGEILCISPLLAEIELDKIRLPQNVDTEVLALQNLLNLLKISVQRCSDDYLAEYTVQAYSILSDITTCVNRILG